MQEVKDLAKKWWLVVLQGIVGIAIGLLMIVWPGKSLALITMLFGLFVLIEGVILSIVVLFHTKTIEKWGLWLLQGVVAILIGLAIFSWPVMTMAILFFFIALWVLIGGIVMIFRGIRMRKEVDAAEWFMIAGGVISILIAVFFFGNPQLTVQLAGVLVGLVILLSGIFTTAFGFQLRSTSKKVHKLQD